MKTTNKVIWKKKTFCLYGQEKNDDDASLYIFIEK